MMEGVNSACLQDPKLELLLRFRSNIKLQGVTDVEFTTQSTETKTEGTEPIQLGSTSENQPVEKAKPETKELGE